MNTRKIFVSALAISIGALITIFAMNPAPDTESVAAHLVDKNNKAVDFNSFKGKVVFVNNWASWCPPCVAEMPTIQKLKNKVKEGNIVFVMVSFDDNAEKAKSFMNKKGYDLEVYFPGKNYPYSTSSIPATFILNKSGEIVSKYEGMADYSSDDFVGQLRKLSKDKNTGL